MLTSSRILLEDRKQQGLQPLLHKSPGSASLPCLAQACGQEQECVDLYKSLEATHPSAQIRKQAANLRFILEAPRLKLRPDERVSVPVLESGGRYACAAWLFSFIAPRACCLRSFPAHAGHRYAVSLRKDLSPDPSTPLSDVSPAVSQCSNCNSVLL